MTVNTGGALGKCKSHNKHKTEEPDDESSELHLRTAKQTPVAHDHRRGFRPHRGALPPTRGAGGAAPESALHLGGVGRCGESLRTRAAGARYRAGTASGDLVAELRRVVYHPVRYGEDR